MSAWPRPTTADIGLRAFARSPSRLFDEVTLGMQQILVSSESASNSEELVRHSAQWNVAIPATAGDQELLLVHWLEEVLYRSEVHRQWCVSCSVMLREQNGELQAHGSVSWVNADDVEQEVEIKAVTTHELQIFEIGVGKTAVSKWEEVPNFDGPGWVADVVFDI
ncbi:MAG TPA: archease [Candidatus Poseidoniaceae archaeon]|nr:MAG TPA: archease [Candidatus Poseidoniales archaeon]HII11503.1 archease [Candidatus Poseidoniaceae archaeon]